MTLNGSLTSRERWAVSDPASEELLKELGYLPR